MRAHGRNWGEKGTPIVLLTIDVPDNLVLLSDFDYWHCVLNDGEITVLETKVFSELQEKYLADPKSGPCPCFKAGDTFLLKRTPEQDDFYHLMNGKFCGEAWHMRLGICREKVLDKYHFILYYYFDIQTI